MLFVCNASQLQIEQKTYVDFPSRLEVTSLPEGACNVGAGCRLPPVAAAILSMAATTCVIEYDAFKMAMRLIERTVYTY